MNIVAGITFFAAVIATTIALDPARFQNCPPNQDCTQRRGLIQFDWNALPFSQKFAFGGRSWIIRSPTGQETTVSLIFKDYNLRGVMYIAMTSNGRTVWKKITGNNTPKNFEMLISNVTSVTLYVTASERERFHAFYFLGCDILTEPSSEIVYPTVGQSPYLRSTCWIIKPAGVNDIGRIYVSLRDVYLMKDASITIGNLHTDSQVARISSTVPHELFGIDASGKAAILIDLECNRDLGTCDEFGNVFSSSYYTVDTKDLSCIETQKHCGLDPWYLPQSVCNRPCPALDVIVNEELAKEGPVRQIAVLKSAGSPTLSNATEEVETEEDMAENKTKITKKASSKPVRCQLKKKYCKCLKTRDDAKKYCFSKRKCKAFKGCALACFWSRFTLCAEIKSSASIKLLSG